MMKKFLLLLLVYFSFSFGNDFCVFDANGNCVSVLHDMREAQNAFQEKGFKKYYIASKEKSVAKIRSYRLVKPTKSIGRKKWYEVDWNQGVKLCPENKLDAKNGFWIVNGSAHVDFTNCVYVDGSPYTRSILVLFARNMNDLTDADSSWILVNQAIVNLKGKVVFRRGNPLLERLLEKEAAKLCKALQLNRYRRALLSLRAKQSNHLPAFLFILQLT